MIFKAAAGAHSLGHGSRHLLPYRWCSKGQFAARLAVNMFFLIKCPINRISKLKQDHNMIKCTAPLSLLALLEFCIGMTTIIDDDIA